METSNIFGARLREKRKENGLTQKQLADIIGAKHNSVSDWERGCAMPDPDTIVLICETLNVSPSYMLPPKRNEMPVNNSNALSPDALRLARIYDELQDEQSKKLLRLVAEHERGRARSVSQPSGHAVPVREAICDGSVEMKEAARRERKDMEIATELTPNP